MKIYNIHIRKTAGTALREQIRLNIENNEICPELSEFELFAKHKRDDIKIYLDQFALFTGHYYTLSQYLPKNTFIFTMLREPISRCLSEINQMYNDQKDLMHDYVKDKKKHELFGDSRLDQYINNAQTRQLLSNAGYDYDSLDDNKRVQYAISYLDQLDFVGIQEAFDTSLFLLAKKLAWKIPEKIKKINTEITKSGMKLHHKIHFIGKVHDNNRLDIQVYTYAQKKFDQMTYTDLNSKETALFTNLKY